jgi:hypothetical protein
MIESAVVSMWALEMTQRVGPARAAWYSARVISIGAMQSSLPHSQNTVITGSSALIWNLSIRSGDALVDLAAETAALQFTFLCCHLRPFQCESVVAARQPIGISLWSQCDTAD